MAIIIMFLLTRRDVLWCKNCDSHFGLIDNMYECISDTRDPAPDANGLVGAGIVVVSFGTALVSIRRALKGDLEYGLFRTRR